MKPFTLTADSQFPIERAVFKLSGPDARQYLNGQISQDVSLATESKAPYAIVANFKGKMDGDLYVRQHGEDLLIDCDPSLREELFTRLDRYIIADDAELSDVSDEIQFTHIIEPSREIPGSWSCTRLGQYGVDVIRDCVPELEATPICEADAERARITHMIPKWGHELDNETLPPEAGLEERAISYTKGCYTGQEVISRMKSAGKTNRHLVLLKIDAKVHEGTPLITGNASTDKPAGVITSVCEIDGTHIALAYRKRKYQDSNTFTCGEANAEVISS
ncbi:hypothetical protein SAMN02745181_2990 [Rubritalea squalenifaciens DSM 18772]|uniref:Uncharacterized protein n=1 Tax=Rubritalea squalenifaciens DSM 18772 TaxID=1123071 RepID=A0A1M6NWA3_9BACT|nr:folate-binding protein YgfZ [Rubritalea squalenifaciens]SHJ99930.1 hypothetical protein SAMN02745181_2990 [Rubritalea squalenifaciens DSM 18772]